MKKIFTLLLCMVALSAAASDITVQQCIDIVLGVNNSQLNAVRVDADRNNDGVVDITDVTVLIDEQLQLSGMRNNAPARQDGDETLQQVVNGVLDGAREVNDVNERIANDK